MNQPWQTKVEGNAQENNKIQKLQKSLQTAQRLKRQMTLPGSPVPKASQKERERERARETVATKVATKKRKQKKMCNQKTYCLTNVFV